MPFRSFPRDNVTVAEWRYLLSRFPGTDDDDTDQAFDMTVSQDAKDRRDQLVAILRRLVRGGKKPADVHRALMLGIKRYEAHAVTQQSRTQLRQQSAVIERARKDVNRALASLRRLVPPGFPPLDDDELFELRDWLLEPVAVPLRRPRRGRPWEWKREAEDALRQAELCPRTLWTFLRELSSL